MAINRRKPRELAYIGGFLEVAPMMMVMMTLWSPQDTAEIVTMSGSSGRLGHRLAIFQRYDRLIDWMVRLWSNESGVSFLNPTFWGQRNVTLLCLHL